MTKFILAKFCWPPLCIKKPIENYINIQRFLNQLVCFWTSNWDLVSAHAYVCTDNYHVWDRHYYPFQREQQEVNVYSAKLIGSQKLKYNIGILNHLFHLFFCAVLDNLFFVVIYLWNHTICVHVKKNGFNRRDLIVRIVPSSQSGFGCKIVLSVRDVHRGRESAAALVGRRLPYHY